MEFEIKSGDEEKQVTVNGQQDNSMLVTLTPCEADVFSRWEQKWYKRKALNIKVEAKMPSNAKIHMQVPDVLHYPYGSLDLDSEIGETTLIHKLVPPVSLGVQSGFWTTLINIIGTVTTVDGKGKTHTNNSASLVPVNDVYAVTFHIGD
jgi:hypothetical protein